MWTLSFGFHEDRTPTHGYAETREAAMRAFAKSWRREQIAGRALSVTHIMRARETPPRSDPRAGFSFGTLMLEVAITLQASGVNSNRRLRSISPPPLISSSS
jgi:hypothetical protein